MAQRPWIRTALALAALPLLAAAAPAGPPTRLFAEDSPLRISIQGPVSRIVRSAATSRQPHPAVLTSTAPAERHDILLSARGLSRRTRDFCQFPPLRVELAARPAATSLFERQRRLKLVTHCRPAASHQQHVLLEYAAYRLFSRISPAGLRVRLATVDYVNDDGEPLTSRLGFFIEDPDDAARRVGMKEVKASGAVSSRSLNPADAAKAALFQYMIGNLDWSMRAGPGGSCCHNFELLGPAGAAASGLVPVPYDFDFSGLVNAPYAVPPDSVPVRSVRERRYRGYCIHNAQALAAAAEYRAKRDSLLSVLNEVPQLDERTRRRASAYLQDFFADIATDESVQKKLLRTCIN
jgi:hypothetical protein